MIAGVSTASNSTVWPLPPTHSCARKRDHKTNTFQALEICSAWADVCLGNVHTDAIFPATWDPVRVRWRVLWRSAGVTGITAARRRLALPSVPCSAHPFRLVWVHAGMHGTGKAAGRLEGKGRRLWLAFERPRAVAQVVAPRPSRQASFVPDAMILRLPNKIGKHDQPTPHEVLHRLKNPDHRARAFPGCQSPHACPVGKGFFERRATP